MVVCIFRLGILYKVISLTPVIMFFNYTRPCTRYLFSSFVPSVVSLWNNLPDHIKVSPLSVFKAHVSHQHDCYSCGLLSICDINFSQLINYHRLHHHQLEQKLKLMHEKPFLVAFLIRVYLSFHVERNPDVNERIVYICWKQSGAQ